MMAWLQASAFLLLSVLLARKLCASIGGWLSYLWIFRPLVKRAPPVKGHKLQVIVCGFPRSGTMSIMQALEILGFPCLHGVHLGKPTTGELFIKALTSGDPKYWEELLDGYACVGDFIGTCGYKKLMEIFPNVKIILNIRDPNNWYDSIYQTIIGIIFGHRHSIFKIFTPWPAKCFKIALCDNFFNGKPKDRQTCINAYIHHTYEVKQQVAPHNLLVYNIELDDGWSKLCDFLDVQIPGSPYPNTNNRKKFNMRVDKLAMIYTMVLSLYIAFVSCILFYLIC